MCGASGSVLSFTAVHMLGMNKMKQGNDVSCQESEQVRGESSKAGAATWVAACDYSRTHLIGGPGRGAQSTRIRLRYPGREIQQDLDAPLLTVTSTQVNDSGPHATQESSQSQCRLCWKDCATNLPETMRGERLVLRES